MKTLNIKFDKRYELIFGLQYTVGKKNNFVFPWIKEEPTDYEKEFYDMAHQSISKDFENYILNGGFGYYEGCCKIASSISDNYEMQGTNTEKISKWLKEFVEKSNFERFFQDHQEYYDKVKQDLERLLNKKNLSFPQVFADFYGQDAKPMQIILSNFLRGSFGLELEEILSFVAGMHLYKENQFQNSIFKTLFHEYSHPYVNPLGNKYFSNIEIPNIQEETIASGLNQCYFKKETIINEYVVRAVEIYLSDKYNEIKDLTKFLEYHKMRGFLHIEELLFLLNNKDKYTTFEQFYKSEIVPYFINLEERLEKECVRKNTI